MKKHCAICGKEMGEYLGAEGALGNDVSLCSQDCHDTFMRKESARISKSQRLKNAGLRDTFAAAALTGLLAHDGASEDAYWYVMRAYKYADAMLKQREAE